MTVEGTKEWFSQDRMLQRHDFVVPLHCRTRTSFARRAFLDGAASYNCWLGEFATRLPVTCA